jgi:hypothetical protein
MVARRPTLPPSAMIVIGVEAEVGKGGSHHLDEALEGFRTTDAGRWTVADEVFGKDLVGNLEPATAVQLLVVPLHHRASRLGVHRSQSPCLTGMSE